MAEVVPSRIFVGRLVFFGLAMTIVFVQLLPLDTLPTRWPAPDLLLAVTLAWVARRPDHAPVIIIAAVFFLCDLMFQRPPGLMAGLVVILTEWLRKRALGLRAMPIGVEWASVAAGLIAVILCYRLVLAMLLLPQDPLGLQLTQTGMTILSYPLVVLVAHFIFGVTRPAPGQVDSLGHRI
jgi:rod shape-determining protein MreD